jgi:hypothetical protein
MSYDRLYSKGGFKYSIKLWLPRIQDLVNKHGIEGKVLDAPAGDGFWSKLLRVAMERRQLALGSQIKCSVVATDLSIVGCKKSRGIVWNLNEFNSEWEGKFNWVFSRGISHLHKETIDTTPFVHLAKYAKNIVVIYSTTQTNRQSSSGCHFNHRKADIDNAMQCLTTEPGTSWTSYMVKSYYHFARQIDD